MATACRVGMVFQIVDDILDMVATDEELGKPVGNDLVEGVYTLPVIRAAPPIARRYAALSEQNSGPEPEFCSLTADQI